MADREGRPGRPVSPYSRSGLFPWGRTYDVPVRRDGTRLLSHTPCHLRLVEVPGGGEPPRDLRCPACGRQWRVALTPGTSPRTATWTA